MICPFKSGWMPRVDAWPDMKEIERERIREIAQETAKAAKEELNRGS